MSESLAAFEAALDSTPTFKAGAAPRLLSVTECLPFTGDRNSPAMIAACDRGTAVHKLTEKYDRGESYDASVYGGYLSAWISFRNDTGAEMVSIETKIGGADVGYEGTLDRVAIIGKSVWILDLKTGRPWPTHGIQTAAYEHAYRIMMNVKPTTKIKRACVHLTADGEYKMCDHTGIHDYNIFLAYRRIALFEVEHGLRVLPPRRY